MLTCEFNLFVGAVTERCVWCVREVVRREVTVSSTRRQSSGTPSGTDIGNTTIHLDLFQKKAWPKKKRTFHL